MPHPSLTQLFITPEESSLEIAENMVLKNGGRISNLNEIDTLSMPIVDLTPIEEKAWLAVGYLIDECGYTIYHPKITYNVLRFAAAVIFCIIIAIIYQTVK